MTRRTRSILVDSTTGKIFTNVTATGDANSSNLIAGTLQKSGGFSIPNSQSARITNNLGGKNGFNFSTAGVVTEVSINSVIAPKGTGIQINLKRGTTYATSTVVGTYTLAELQTTSTTVTSITVASGDSLYVDITSVGTVVAGTGVSVKFKYYLG
jgi:hypothetical protein